MDLDNIAQIGELINEILETEPSDADLNYDDDWIAVYDDLHNLRETLRRVGYC